MGAVPGFVAILAVELHFPEAGSLKGKRKHVLSAKAQLQNRFGASVAEVDHHDLWQRCALTAAFVARGARRGPRARAEQWLAGQEWLRPPLVSPDTQRGRASAAARGSTTWTDRAPVSRADAPGRTSRSRGRRGGRRGLRDPRIGLVTVTGVVVSPDLHDARVYVSVLGNERKRRATLAVLESARGVLQSRLARELGCSEHRS